VSRPASIFLPAVSHEFFSVPGTAPLPGRGFLPEEDPQRRQRSPMVTNVTLARVLVIWSLSRHSERARERVAATRP
jgi:hypothetical protein